MQRPIMRPGVGAVIAVATVAAIVSLPPLVRATEEKLPPEKVPRPVLDTVRARFKDAALSDAARETEKGRLVYEVTVRQGGRDIDVTLTPDGKLLMIEKTIASKDLPLPVAKTLAEKYPRAVYRIVEEIVEVKGQWERVAYYEVLLVAADKRAREVQITPDGKVVTEERSEGEEEGEAEDEREDGESSDE